MATQKEHKRTPLWKKILGSLFLLALLNAVIGIITDSSKTQGGSSSSSSAVATPQLSPKEEALRDLELKFEWGKGGFGSIMMVDFTFTNKGKYAVKDIKVECRSAANSGTFIDKNKKTIYESVQPGETKRIDHFNMGFLNSQATSTACLVDDLKVEQ